MLNAYWEPLRFELPPLDDGVYWHRIVDTILPTSEDFCVPQKAPQVAEDFYLVAARTTVVLMALSAENSS